MTREKDAADWAAFRRACNRLVVKGWTFPVIKSEVEFVFDEVAAGKLEVPK